MNSCPLITFGGIESEFSDFKNSKIILQSLPYDGTSTWGKGADSGFEAFIDASNNLELYDIETNSSPYKEGIHIYKPMNHLKDSADTVTPIKAFENIYERTKELIDTGKFLTFFGGEHSVSIGIIQAFSEKYEDLTVLHLDAHADLRPDYLGTKYNHACAMNYAYNHCNLVQAGIRSMALSETKYIKKEKLFTAHEIMCQSALIEGTENCWMNKALEQMGNNVYISLDLDVFDPSIMPSTGTPEPGGLDWYRVTNFLSLIFKNKNVLAFDIVELAPKPGNPAPDFLTAKLYYKMLAWKFCLNCQFE
jgi:agmatinase